MTQYVYLVTTRSADALEIVGKELEPKSSSVLDFLDDLVEIAGAAADTPLSLKNEGGIIRMEGRLIPAAKITEKALCDALSRASDAHTALRKCFLTLTEQPGDLFKKAPSGKKNWDIFRELLDLRTLLLQARSKSGYSIAVCND